VQLLGRDGGRAPAPDRRHPLASEAGEPAADELEEGEGELLTAEELQAFRD